MQFTDPAWRERRAGTAVRVAESVLRKAVPGPRRPVVTVAGDIRMYDDLQTALGLRLFRLGMRVPELPLLERLLHPGDTFVDGVACPVRAPRDGPNVFATRDRRRVERAGVRILGLPG